MTFESPLPKLVPVNWRERMNDPRGELVYDREYVLALIAAHRAAHRAWHEKNAAGRRGQ